MSESTSVSRRRVVRGTAWSVPTVAAVAAAPAFAASPCRPSIDFSGGLTYNFGMIGPNVSTTTQSLEIGGQTYVSNLPAGVTVTTVTYQFWVQNRVGQTTAGPGAFWLGNTTSDKKETCTSSGCTTPWTPTDRSGFATTVTNTQNLISKVYPDGATRQSWDLNMRWDASRDTNIAGRYTTTSTGCRNFTTGPSARFKVTYSGVTAFKSTTDPNKVVNSYVTVTATLSNGQALTVTYQSS